jgi:Calcineurin-like phosphoesterase
VRLVVISDPHADSILFGLSRFGEVERAMLASVRTAIARKADAWICLGDLTNPDSGSSAFRCARLALQCAIRLHEAGIRSMWIAGNHDVIEDGSGETTLEPLRALGASRGVDVYDRPEWTALGPTGLSPTEGTVPCLVLPYTASSHPYDPEEYVRGTWDKATKGCRYVVVLEHMDVFGAVLGEETVDMARGRRLTYPREVIEQIAAERNQQVIQLGGHLHLRQRVGGLQIVGSPVRHAFGERMNDPGFLTVDVPENGP